MSTPRGRGRSSLSDLRGNVLDAAAGSAEGDLDGPDEDAVFP